MLSSKDIRKIKQVASEAKVKTIDVFETLPPDIQTDETFEFFYVCLIQSMINDITNWQTDDLTIESNNN